MLFFCSKSKLKFIISSLIDSMSLLRLFALQILFSYKFTINSNIFSELSMNFSLSNKLRFSFNISLVISTINFSNSIILASFFSVSLFRRCGDLMINFSYKLSFFEICCCLSFMSLASASCICSPFSNSSRSSINFFLISFAFAIFLLKVMF